MITRRDVVTTAAGAATSLGLLHTAAALAADNNAWLYSAPDGKGAFQYSDGHWIETTPTGTQWIFQETQRIPSYLELHDADRRFWLRLHPAYGEWRQEPDPAWHRWWQGRWGSADEIQPLSDYLIRLGYLIPADRKPVANYEQKIGVLLYFVNELYQQSARRYGYRMRDLPLRMSGGKAPVTLIHSTKPAAYYHGVPNYEGATGRQRSLEHWRRLVDDIPPQFGVPQRHLMLVFTESFGEGPAQIEWQGTVSAASRYSKAGGVGIFSAWILRDEFCALTVAEQRKLFFDTTPIKGRTAWGYGRPDSPRHHFIEDGFGAVTHELGHAFGLPHDMRDDAHDIMGQGFRIIHWNFADPPQPEKGGTFSQDNVRMLLSSRYLASDLDPTDDIPPEVKARIVARVDKPTASVTVEVDASDNRGLRAVLFHAPQQDSVVGGRALSGKRQSFTQQLAIKPPGSADVQIDVIVTDTGGNYTTKRITSATQ